MMHQRSAEEDDFRSQALGIYDSLVKEHVESSLPQAAKDELVHVIEAAKPVEVEEGPMIVEPLYEGPIVQPLAATGVPWWYWLIFGIVVGLLAIIMLWGRIWPIFTPEVPLVPAVELPMKVSAYEF